MQRCLTAFIFCKITHTLMRCNIKWLDGGSNWIQSQLFLIKFLSLHLDWWEIHRKSEDILWMGRVKLIIKFAFKMISRVIIWWINWLSRIEIRIRSAQEYTFVTFAPFFRGTMESNYCINLHNILSLWLRRHPRWILRQVIILLTCPCINLNIKWVSINILI